VSYLWWVCFAYCVGYVAEWLHRLYVGGLFVLPVRALSAFLSEPLIEPAGVTMWQGRPAIVHAALHVSSAPPSCLSQPAQRRRRCQLNDCNWIQGHAAVRRIPILYCRSWCLLLLVGIALAAQAIPPIATHFSVVWSVVGSVVCHIRAPCLNSSTDLDAIWQVHLKGPMTHCVRRGSSIRGGGDLGVNLNPKQNIQLQIAAAIWRIQTNSWVNLPGRFRFLPNYFDPCYKTIHGAEMLVVPWINA